MMLHFFVPDNVSSKQSILSSTSMLNLPIMHFFGRNTDLSPTASNFWYDTAVDDSSIKKF